MDRNKRPEGQANSPKPSAFICLCHEFALHTTSVSMDIRHKLQCLDKRVTNLAVVLLMSLIELVLSYLWSRQIFDTELYRDVNALLYYSGSAALLTTIWTSLSILFVSVATLYTSIVALVSFGAVFIAWVLQLAIWMSCEIPGLHTRQKRSPCCLPLPERLIPQVHSMSLAKGCFGLAILLSISIYLLQITAKIRHATHTHSTIDSGIRASIETLHGSM